jgi:serine/threonine protein kinase
MAVKISQEAKDLLLKLLDKNPKTRLKVGQIKQHKFFENYDFEGVYYKKLEAPFKPDMVT